MSTNLTNLDMAKWKKRIVAYAACNILYHGRLIDRGSFKILPHRRILLPVLSSRSVHPHVVRSINHLQKLFYCLDNGLTDSFSIQIFNRTQTGTAADHLVQSYRFDFNRLTVKVDIKGQATRLISIAPERPIGGRNQLGRVATTGRPLTDYLPGRLFEKLSSIEPLPALADVYYCFSIGNLDTDRPSTSNRNRRTIEDVENNSTEMENAGHNRGHKRTCLN